MYKQETQLPQRQRVSSPSIRYCQELYSLATFLLLTVGLWVNLTQLAPKGLREIARNDGHWLFKITRSHIYLVSIESLRMRDQVSK